MRKTIRIRKTSPLLVPNYILPEEIRVGNIIMDRKGEPFFITVYNIGVIMGQISNYLAVPLTEEILLSAGFMQSRNKFYKNSSIGFYFLFTGTIGILYKADRGSVSIPVRYFHQLQNIWYFHIGEHLKYPLSNMSGDILEDTSQ